MTFERAWEVVSESFLQVLTAGMLYTVPLTVISFALAMVIATLAALAQYAQIRPLRPILRFYIWIFRGTPILVQLFVVFYGLPNIGIILDPFPSAILVFALNTGAYCAEAMRAALESVPRGQIEAGYCVGMRYMQIMRRIVLPQALRTAFPSLMNSMIGLVKDTSLASCITVAEMLMATQKVIGRTYAALPMYLEVGFIYLSFSTVLTKLQSVGEKRLNSYGHH